jgi:bifunctional non-homologous end joining protein LigD
MASAPAGAAAARDAQWVEPRLVAEVEFTTWTRDGRVRHPSFKELREDKRPKAVVVERSDARGR